MPEKTKETLEQEHRFLQALLDDTPAGILATDENGRIVLFNRMAEKIFGYSQDEIVGQTIETLLPERFRKIHITERHDFNAAPSIRKMGSGRDLTALHKSGRELPVEIGLSPIPLGRGTLAFVMDITERKRLEKAREDLLSTVSHELRTPLTSIHMAIENMREGLDGPLNEEQAKSLQVAWRNVERLSRMINNLLDLSRLESGRITPRFASIKPSSLISETVEGLRTLATQGQIELVCEIPPSLPLIAVDAEMIGRLIYNLLDNALRFAKRRVFLNAELQEDSILITVVDDGPGIPPGAVKRIFDKFEQVNRHIGGRGYRGTGLGLAICKEIVDLHHGKIWAESVPGEGSRFHVSLPT